VSYKALKAFLARHPKIRTLKPSKQRLLIHAGDWSCHRTTEARAAGDALENSPEVVASFVDEARKRQERIRQRKVGE
jgi:hypothetical protein